MNYHEKHVRSMSSSLPNRSNLDDQPESSASNKSFTLFAGNIKNPPRITSSDDGSGTASNPKNIINNRRHSESFAVYSGNEYFASSSQNSPNDMLAYLNAYKEDNSSAYFSPDALQHHMYPHVMNVDKKIVLYKTEMCRTFEETGNCKYGTKCQFAHDPAEIRNIPRHPRYKTEICKTFWQLGNCPYGKRCCFIHTENELRNRGGDSKNALPRQQQQQSQSAELKDMYGSLDLTIAEDSSLLVEIQSQNTSRSESPSKAAEDLKKSISSVGNNSIFTNLSISNLEQLKSSKSITERRRRSIIDDRIEELAMLVGSNCTITNETTTASDTAAPSAEDPEFKTINANTFELWSCESPNSSDLSIEGSTLTTQNENKFALFDKSPGARNSNGIWSKGSFGQFIPGSQFYEKDSSNINATEIIFDSLPPSGTSSSKSQVTNHQQLLIDMLNLLDN